jgi:hypothetical protein
MGVNKYSTADQPGPEIQPDPLDGVYKVEKRAGGRVLVIGGPYGSTRVKIDPPLREDEVECEVKTSEQTDVDGRVVTISVVARVRLPSWAEEALFAPFREKALVSGPYGQVPKPGEVFMSEIHEVKPNYRGCRRDKDRDKRLLKAREDAKAFDPTNLKATARRAMLEYVEGRLSAHREEFTRTHLNLFTESSGGLSDSFFAQHAPGWEAIEGRLAALMDMREALRKLVQEANEAKRIAQVEAVKACLTASPIVMDCWPEETRTSVLHRLNDEKAMRQEGFLGW